MKTQMFLASIVVAGIVAGGVLFFLAYSSADADEMWVVTGTSFTVPVSDRLTIGVEYTAPEGRTGRWEFSADPKALSESPMYKCWGSVAIGAPLPDCFRTTSPPRQ